MYQDLEKHVKNYVNPTQEDLYYLTTKLNEVSVAKGKFLLHPGTHIRHEYFVIKGCLKAFYLDEKGSRHIIQFAIENWWVGDFDAFYNAVPSKLHIEAIEESTLAAISYNNLQSLFIEAPIFERYFRILVTGGFISQRKRILSTLGKNTKERYLEFCEDYPRIEDRVPNYQIANYLGVSAESLSRIRRRLKR